MRTHPSARRFCLWYRLLLLGTPAAVWLAAAQAPLPDGFHPGIAGQVYALAVQADGKILVGGSFTALGGQPRTNLARLDPDGTLDPGFDPRAGGQVNALVVQEDGRVLVGGSFSQVAGRLRDNLARLHANGSLDSGFSGHTDGPVRALALQPDGKVIVAGQFNTLNNYWSYRSGRLHPDGTKNSGFGLDSNSAGVVLAVAVQADGKLLIAGSFASLAGLSRTNLARLQVTAPPPATCRAASRTSPGCAAARARKSGAARLMPRRMARTGVAWAPAIPSPAAGKSQMATLTVADVQKSNEVAFTLAVSNSFGSVTSLVATLAVLDPDLATQPLSQNRELGDAATLSVIPAGTVPFTFQWFRDGVALSGATGDVLTLTNLHASDAGNYTVVICNALGCITSSPAPLTVNAATLDAGFNPGVAEDILWLPPSVNSVVLQTDGKILLSGVFSHVAGLPRNALAQLNVDGTLDPTFNPVVGGD